MADQATPAISAKKLSVVADRGYFKGPEILACEKAGITTYLPRPQTGNITKGQFGKRDFIYSAKDDEYQCPAGERLIRQFSTQEHGQTMNKYWSSACPHCRMKEQCTTGVNRRVTRWEHEAVLDSLAERLEKEPERMRARRQTVAHPFGTLKTWMGYSHFQMRTLKHVSTQMSLHLLAYNLKRALSILGARSLIQAIQA